MVAVLEVRCSALSGPDILLAPHSSVCGMSIKKLDGLFAGAQVVTIGMARSDLDQWFANVCINCRKVYCSECLELGGPTLCPICGEPTKTPRAVTRKRHDRSRGATPNPRRAATGGRRCPPRTPPASPAVPDAGSAPPAPRAASARGGRPAPTRLGAVGTSGKAGNRTAYGALDSFS